MGKQMWSTFVTSKWVGLIHVKLQRKKDPEEAGYGKGSRSAHMSDLYNGLEIKVSFKDAATNNPELSFLRKACTVT